LTGPHIRLFESALAQLPEAFYTPDGKLIGQKILIRTDSAGSSRKFLWHLHHTGVQYSVSYQIPPGRAHMVDWIGNKDYWQPALDQEGAERADAWVINAAEVIPLTGYPPGTTCSCAPSRCTRARNRPCSMRTGTASRPS